MASFCVLRSAFNLQTKCQPSMLIVDLKPSKDFDLLSILKTHFLNFRPRSMSKASKAADREFLEGKPPELELLADFYFADEKPIKCVNVKSALLSGFWSFQRSKTSDVSRDRDTKTLEEANLSSYVSGISQVISKFEHQEKRGIPLLYSGDIGSVDRFGEMGLHTDRSSLYLLCGRWDLFPVAVRTEKSVLILKSDVFEELKPGYSKRIEKLGGKKTFHHDFAYYERCYSIDRLINAIDTVAAGLENEKDVFKRSYISTLVFMTTHSAKALPVRKFFEDVISDRSRAEYYLPDSVIEFVKKWPEYCKEVNSGNEEFTVDGRVVVFAEMQKLMTLLSPRKEDRKIIEVAPVKKHPMQSSDPDPVKAPFGTVLFGRFVDFFWDLLGRYREG